MKRGPLSPQLQQRLGALADQRDSVQCDCGTEFAAVKGTLSTCPNCGKNEQATAAEIAKVVNTINVVMEQRAKDKSMTTPASVNGLGRLMRSLHSLNDSTNKLADDLDGHMKRINAGIEVTKTVVSTVKAAADELEAANSLFSNGAPA